MKHLKLTLFSLVALFISATIFVSCSEDNETTTNETTNKNVDSFLKSFYSESFNYGRKAEITIKTETSFLNKTASFEEVNVTEVFVGNQEKANGYVVTDKVTGEFLYFVNVDRTSFILTSVDNDKNEQLTFNNINTNESYTNTNEFDFIEIALNESNNGISNKVGPRFFGTGYSFGANSNTIPCFKGVYSNYYVFGINVTGEPEPVQNANGGNLSVPCDQMSYP
uniref:hypothetical protein n=1 Tax=Flavobacterium sp. TaxID=239 RepID=UPI0040489347